MIVKICYVLIITLLPISNSKYILYVEYIYSQIGKGGNNNMIKNIALFSALFVLAGVAAMIGVKQVQAASANAAIVVNDIGCSMLDGNGNPVLVTESHVVSTSSGNSMITCKGDVAPSTSAKRAVHYDYSTTPTLCSTTFGMTDDWHLVVTPSGKATLVCHVHP